MPLPSLITTTPEGRRVYSLRFSNRLIIDPHFEEKHSSYVDNKLIWELVQQLNNHTFFPDPPKRESVYQYFTIEDIQCHNKSYCLVWCWKRRVKGKLA